MKKAAIFFLMCLLLVCAIACSNTGNSDYFFVEIEAYDDNKENLALAKEIKEKVYSYLAVSLEECESAADTESAVKKHLDDIEYIVNGILDKQDVSYDGCAKVETVRRDKRQVGNVVIGRGSYKTLVITLGEGVGKTDFALLYPSLTYVEGEDEIILASKLYELIKESKDKWKEKTT